ncbi:hypothetical protein LCGC14_0991570 [marine sediment metagenome]|uniref:Uncharacterized protein n=1 Tax=marine sediment metagenome TaxID=412755 RepID=A0A0F9N5N5_9ZZZZ
MLVQDHEKEKNPEKFMEKVFKDISGALTKQCAQLVID